MKNEFRNSLQVICLKKLLVDERGFGGADSCAGWSNVASGWKPEGRGEKATSLVNRLRQKRFLLRQPPLPKTPRWSGERYRGRDGGRRGRGQRQKIKIKV